MAAEGGAIHAGALATNRSPARDQDRALNHRGVLGLQNCLDGADARRLGSGYGPGATGATSAPAASDERAPSGLGLACFDLWVGAGRLS